MEKVFREIDKALEREGGSDLVPIWFIPWYELIIDEWETLGVGGFGSVCRAKWLECEVVVKRVIIAGTTSRNDSQTDYSESMLSAPEATINVTKRAEALKMFRREVEIWFELSHPHVIQLFGACHVGRPFFVCEYATNGTLVSYLRKNPDQLWTKLYEAALGVQYLHARKVIHGDLKGNNIVIGGDFKAKVTDFGLSSIESSEAETLVSGAWNWVAPECLSGAKTRPTYASDVYSLGMCCVEALRVVVASGSGKSTQSLPWTVADRAAVKYHAMRGRLPSRPTICEDKQWDLIKQMCALNPKERIKISTVVDELAKLASANVVNQTDRCIETSEKSYESVKSVSRVISKAKAVVNRFEAVRIDVMQYAPYTRHCGLVWRT